MKKLIPLLILALALSACAPALSASTGSTPAAPADSPAAAADPGQATLTYPVVDTGQGVCYDDTRPIDCASSGAFSGQDAQYAGNAPRYQDNDDGTVSDLVTGLTWQQDPGEKVTYAQAVAGASALSLGGYTDWRLPTIKELYSLILFNGTDVSACPNGVNCTGIPFIDTRYFAFSYGNTAAGERAIDAQYWSSTRYVGTTMGGNATAFGVNFADGRIKGYPISSPRGETLQFALYVRGNPDYGLNQFTDNGGGTIYDAATGLTWQQSDSGYGMDWGDALAYCEGLSLAGRDDWRLPDAKELQSIVDYSRAPAVTGTPAIDPLFQVTAIRAEGGRTDYPFYWSSTTHASSNGNAGWAVYVAFGTAFGYMNGNLDDVHGAGAQRSDPKSGDPSVYAGGHGPQGDVVRINNYVRCVSGGSTSDPDGDPASTRPGISLPSGGAQSGAPSGPQGGQSAPGGQPPAEAVQACAASTIGAACSFNIPNGTVSGTCQQISGTLACVPRNGP